MKICKHCGQSIKSTTITVAELIDGLRAIEASPSNPIYLDCESLVRKFRIVNMTSFYTRVSLDIEPMVEGEL